MLVSAHVFVCLPKLLWFGMLGCFIVCCLCVCLFVWMFVCGVWVAGLRGCLLFVFGVVVICLFGC